MLRRQFLNMPSRHIQILKAYLLKGIFILKAYLFTAYLDFGKGIFTKTEEKHI